MWIVGFGAAAMMTYHDLITFCFDHFRHESITDVLEKANNLLQAAESENELYKNRLQEKDKEVTKFIDKFQRNQNLLETMLRTVKYIKAEKESCQDQVERLRSRIQQSTSEAVSYCRVLGDKYSTERSSHLLEHTKVISSKHTVLGCD